MAQALFDRPVIRVDEAMAKIAVEQGKRVGVIATLSTTLAPTAALVRRKALAKRPKHVDIVECLCEGAFPGPASWRAIPRLMTASLARRSHPQSCAAWTSSFWRKRRWLACSRRLCLPALVPAPVFASPRRWVLNSPRDVLSGEARSAAEPDDVATTILCRRSAGRRRFGHHVPADRMAIAVVGPLVQQDLHLTPEKWSWVLSAYADFLWPVRDPFGRTGRPQWPAARASPALPPGGPPSPH